jgi:RNA polymerase sigma factor (sigma-70 family)
METTASGEGPPDTPLLTEEFEVLYRRHVAGLLGYLGRRVGTALAEDLTADTFAIAWTRREAFDRERAAFSSWLFGIAINVLRRHRRQESIQLAAYARHAADPIVVVDEMAIANRLDADAVWPQVAAALADLPAVDRDILTLQAWAGLSYQEIADAVGVPIGTVRSKINRARQRLAIQVRDASRDRLEREHRA